MNLSDIAHLRLANQQLVRPALKTEAAMVDWLGAAQAQDFTGAKWSLGVRLWPTSDAAIESAFNDGRILRTHVLRPTWHFVTPADARWLLTLTSPRVHVANRPMYRTLELDEATLRRAGEVMTGALGGGRALTRDEVGAALEQAGVHTSGGHDRAGQRLAYLMMWAELEGLIISGPRRGKQFTYMRLDERAPAGPSLDGDEALAELAHRYFQSHGPATEPDFARWSGLTLTDSRKAIAGVSPALQREEVAGQAYWFAAAGPALRDPSPTAYLLSIYDEYTIGYKDLSAIGGDEHGATLRAMGNALQNVIILDSRVVGTWRRVIGRKLLTIHLNFLVPVTDGERQAVVAAAEQYGAFLGLAVTVES